MIKPELLDNTGDYWTLLEITEGLLETTEVFQKEVPVLFRVL